MEHWIRGRWICVFGAPRFSVQRPKNPYFEGFRSDVAQKSGAPQTQIQRPHRSGERKVSPKFFRPKFFHGHPRSMPVPKFDTEYDRTKVPPYNGNDPRPPLVPRSSSHIGHGLSEAFYADTVRRVNLLTLAFALYFPAFERLRSTHPLA